MEDKSNNFLERELIINGENGKSFKLTIIKEKDEIIFESKILNDICNIQYSANLNIKSFYENNKIFKKYKSINEIYSEIFKNIKEKELSMSLNNNKIEINLVIDNNKILFILEQKEVKLDNMIINKINEYIDILKNENNNLRNEIIKQKDDNEKYIKELKNEIENIKKEINNKNKVNEEINNILNNELNHNQIIKDIKMENYKIKEKIENVEYQINNIKQKLPDKFPICNSNMMNNSQMNNMNFMNMNLSTNNMNMPNNNNMNMPMNNMNIPINNMNMPNNNMNMPMNNMNMMGFGTFNMMNPNINNNFTKYNPNSNEIKEVLPRSQIYDDDIDGEYIISITFNHNDNRIGISLKSTKTLEDLIKEYANRIDYPEEYIEKDFIFSYNGSTLDIHSQSTLGSLFRKSASITVYDFNSINLWIINFEASCGKKLSMKIDSNETIKYMMERYVKKIHVPKEAIGKDIIFIYNGKNLNNLQNDIVKRVLKNEATITVYNVGNVLGEN